MLFNSYIYIFLFLPSALVFYFFLNKNKLVTAAKTWAVLSSLFFYSWWNPAYLPLIVFSMLFNFGVGATLGNIYTGKVKSRLHPKTLLFAGIVVNIGFLGYYKYADFLIRNLNLVTDSHLPSLDLILPLAISFFTFQQIAYLVDSYKGKTHEYNFLNYCLFVTFFPQLIAGPIVHHKEMMPQFSRLRNTFLNWHNVAKGITVFAMGLFKKTVIADYLGNLAASGFDGASQLNLLEAWAVSLSYTFQIYFDFSGYTDMAIGSALLFNISLPLNFNSPYKARNIQDFWRRWHITLSRWLRDYVYIPLGGNRGKGPRIYVNVFLTFLAGGIWHGAGWTFVIWGVMHGLAAALHRGWGRTGIKLPRLVAVAATFFFVHGAWVFFRANSFHDAAKVFKGMCGMTGIIVPSQLHSLAPSIGEKGDWIVNIKCDDDVFIYLGIVALIAFLAPNSLQISERFKPTVALSVIVAIALIAGIMSMTKYSEFLYFNF